MANGIVAVNDHLGVLARRKRMSGQGERGGREQAIVWQRLPVGKRAPKVMSMSPLCVLYLQTDVMVATWFSSKNS